MPPKLDPWQMVSRARRMAGLVRTGSLVTKPKTAMADDLTKTGSADDRRINIHQDHEVRYWSQHLQVSTDRLRKAVQAVGPMVRDVNNYLRTH